MFFALLLTGIAFAIYPARAHAIIILPALILIPIAQLIAVIVSGLSIPAISIGIFIAKIKKNRRLAIVIPLLLVLTISFVMALILKWKFPENPWI